MKEELIALGPVLERTQVETDEILVIVAEETVEANKVREVVAKDEAFAAERAAEAQGDQRRVRGGARRGDSDARTPRSRRWTR